MRVKGPLRLVKRCFFGWSSWGTMGKVVQSLLDRVSTLGSPGMSTLAWEYDLTLRGVAPHLWSRWTGVSDFPELEQQEKRENVPCRNAIRSLKNSRPNASVPNDSRLNFGPSESSRSP